MTSELDSTGAPILDLIPRQWKETRHAICHIVPKFPVSFYRMSGNEQSRGDSRFVRHSSKVQEIVRVTIIESERDRGNAHFTRAQEFNGFGKAHNAVVFLQKKNLLQEHFCGHSHPMRAIRY